MTSYKGKQERSPELSLIRFHVSSLPKQAAVSCQTAVKVSLTSTKFCPISTSFWLRAIELGQERARARDLEIEVLVTNHSDLGRFRGDETFRVVG